MPLSAHLLGVCGDCHLPRTGRCAARAWPSGGCCAAIRLPAEASIRFRRPGNTRMQDLFPTNRYHRKSGGLTGCSLELTGRILCPKFSNPNLQTQGPGGGSGGGDMRSTIAFTLVILVALLGYQYFFKPTPPPTPTPQTQSQSQRAAAGQAAAAGRARQSQRRRRSRHGVSAAAGSDTRRSARPANPISRSRTSFTRSSSPIAARR